MTADKVAAFAGTMAEFYDLYLVPLNFAPYAEFVAGRAKDLCPRRVLETAAGTGVLTEGSKWPELQRRAVGDEDRRRCWAGLEDGAAAGRLRAS